MEHPQKLQFLSVSKSYVPSPTEISITKVDNSVLLLNVIKIL